MELAIPCPKAIDRITDARCKKAQSCAGARHDDGFELAACQRDVKASMALELDPMSGCPEHVDGRALDQCVHALETETCGLSTYKSDPIVPCRHNALCARGYPGPLQ